MKVPFLDLRVTDEAERLEIHAAIERVLCHGRIILGPDVEQLEAEVAKRVGRRYAIGVNSGTDALIIAQRALGIGTGDEVITTPLSFIATANSSSLVGATPIFADLGPDLNIDPSSIERLITPRTKAILPVHWAGLVCDMKAITRIAEKHSLKVIEDASQAFDAEADGRKAGSFGDIGCFSMNSMKVFASLGEAGMIVTDDRTLYERCVSLRYHGLEDQRYCTAVSQNGRLDTIQAAALLVRLKRLDMVVARRQQIAARYHAGLSNVVTVPEPPPNKLHCYYTYTIQTPRRDELKAYLEANGIEVKIQHSLLMPEHPIYEKTSKGQWDRASQLIKTVLCLPGSEKLQDEQQEYVIHTIRSFFEAV